MPSVNIKQARAQAPAPTGLGAWAERLRSTAMAAVEDTDVEEIMRKQVEKAKAGDAAAARFVLGLVMNQPKVEVRKVVVNRGGKGKAGGGEKARDRVRRLAALHLNQHGDTHHDALAVVCGLPAAKLSKALHGCTWFTRVKGGWSLTPTGRQAVA